MSHSNNRPNILATPGNSGPSFWLSAVPDLIAFILGLGMAWLFSWQTRDLIWSLWLSSLTLGYATIVISLLGAVQRQKRHSDEPLYVPQKVDLKVPIPRLPPTMRVKSTLYKRSPLNLDVFGVFFMLVFFTFHFGMFHFVHGAFVSFFFPLKDSPSRDFPNMLNLSLLALRNYWPFVFAVAISMRQQLIKAWQIPDASMTAPYMNVLRLHFLIFFFAGVHFANLDNFLIYAVVYFVYFFPFSLFFKKPETDVKS